jgi:hypothetical protein
MQREKLVYLTFQIKGIGVEIRHVVPGHSSVDAKYLFGKYGIFQLSVHRKTGIRLIGKPPPFIIGESEYQKMRPLKNNFNYSRIHFKGSIG